MTLLVPHGKALVLDAAQVERLQAALRAPSYHAESVDDILTALKSEEFTKGLAAIASALDTIGDTSGFFHDIADNVAEAVKQITSIKDVADAAILELDAANDILTQGRIVDV